MLDLLKERREGAGENARVVTSNGHVLCFYI